MDDGLQEIQFCPDSDATPLILIHDGGGTIFNYYFLSDLDRPVYGISNPHFDSKQPWPSLEAMAELYAGWIRDTIRSGPVLLGGWSMGGMLSLAIAHQLLNSPIQVQGIIMIDTPYPSRTPPAGAVASAPTFAATTKPDMREKVLASLKEARRLIAGWTVPAWQAKTPPAVLLRCTEREAVPEGAKVALVDVQRDDRMLGWGRYHASFVKESWDIGGSHFGLFGAEHLEDVSDKIGRACRLLERR